MMFLVNEDSLDVLPTIDSSFEDKCHLLRAFRSGEVSKLRTQEERVTWYGRWKQHRGRNETTFAGD